MQNLKNYKKTLKKINILLEFVLIFIMYWLATYMRAGMNYGKTYSTYDSFKLVIIGITFSLTIVVVTFCGGSYFTFHIKNSWDEARKVFVSIAIGVAFECVIIYIFRLEQFSRMLMFYFAMLSFAVVLTKRIIVNIIVNKYDARYDVKSKVLMIGSGQLASLLYETVFKTKLYNMTFVGYLSETKNESIPNYVGDMGKVSDIIGRSEIDNIIIADDEITKDSIKNLVVLATHHNIRISIIPGFSDFLPSKNAVTQIGGNYLFELTALDTCQIMGVNISVTNIEKTFSKIRENLDSWRGKYICVSNVHTTVTASEDDEYKAIQNKAVIALPDGNPLSKFSSAHGYAGASRVTGPDLMRRILAESEKYGWRHYFYGSTQEVLDTLRIVINERYPGAYICGMMSPPFRALTVQEDLQIIKDINEAKPDFIWVGLGAPKQEVWMAAHEDKVSGLMIGVGAAFDYESGKIKRAPKWMQKLSLEWLYRLLQDPKRLFSRYLRTNTKYIIWKYMHGGKSD